MQYSYDFSVMMITYNHEKYLAQAIDSIVSQKFYKKLEVVIGVDKSEDDTLQICKEYQQQYPSLIKLIVHSSNVGMYVNFVSTLKACQGKYIAILEGDDYWTDPQKLQTQFDFFERNRNCILSGGLSAVLLESEERFVPPFLSGLFKGKVFSKQDIVHSNRFSTLTTAFRSDALQWSELDKLAMSPHLDWGVYLCLNYENGKFAYRFNSKFGTYRMHEGGVYSLVGQEKRASNFLKTIYALSTLSLSCSERQYLKALFANYALRLKSKEFITSSATYNSFYQDSLIIYTTSNRLRKEYICSIYKKILNKDCNIIEAVTDNFELIRQTKRSKRVYTNIFLIPFFLLVWLLKLQTNMIRQKMLQ